MAPISYHAWCRWIPLHRWKISFKKILWKGSSPVLCDTFFFTFCLFVSSWDQEIRHHNLSIERQNCHQIFMVHVCCRWLQLHIWKISFKKHSVREILQYVVTHFLPFLFVCFIWASENKALLYSHKAKPAAKSFKVVYRTNTVYILHLTAIQFVAKIHPEVWIWNPKH